MGDSFFQAICGIAWVLDGNSAKALSRGSLSSSMMRQGMDRWLVLGSSKISESVLLSARKISPGCAFKSSDWVGAGELFARMDQDDICHPERLEKQVSFLIQNPQVDLVGCACLTIDKKNQVTGQLSPPTGHSQICQTPWKGFPLAHPSWMGKTSWFRKNPYRVPAPFLCEDQELLLRLHRSSQFANLPDTYLAYRLRDRTNLGQLTKTRIAWWKVQTKFFIKKGEIKNLILGLLSLFGATLFDFFKKMGISRAQKIPCGIYRKFQKSQKLPW